MADSPMLQTDIAETLEKLAWTWAPTNQRRSAKLAIAAMILRRRADLLGDQVCSSCGCAELDPCGDELEGYCGWSDDGRCTHCARQSSEPA